MLGTSDQLYVYALTNTPYNTISVPQSTAVHSMKCTMKLASSTSQQAYALCAEHAQLCC